MHKSAYEIGAKFLERYWSSNMKNILEIGAFDVNGSLKDFKHEDCEWIGVDLEPGKGVDIVIERASRLPFEENSFDLVIATSIFEHDPTFWLTFSEMLRVVKPNGFVYVCAPSNGWVHRYPMDVYRFYPDAGNGLVEWGRRDHPDLQLVESFISERDGDIWNDFCAVFSKTKIKHARKIHTDTPCSNVWSEGVFLENTLVEATEDMRIIESLKSDLVLTETLVQNTIQLEDLEKLNSNQSAEITELRLSLSFVNSQLELSVKKNTEISNKLVDMCSQLELLVKKNTDISHELLLMQKSISWRFTRPLRNLKSWIRK
jgi:SAM-dependent methyltransferase